MSKTTPTFKVPSRQSVYPTKRMALYARVSTQEQTKGDYPSCESQIEELEAYCRAKGWDVHETIKDEGKSAGSLKRPGLTRARWLVENNAIDGVLCTWYDRLTRSREFYVLDKEFRTHNVDFITIHDPADRNTASGRFMEMMLVGAKAYEREQTGEKVRQKMLMRAEKGMWNGGLVPFGLLRDAATKMLVADPDRVSIVEQMFRLYVERKSDFAVRDWLKAHQIKAPGGGDVWAVGSLRDLLTNRRYIAEIEINRQNQGQEDVPELDAYRVVQASHEPLVPVELFELAQAIRSEKAQQYPNNPGQRLGKARSYTWSQCDRVYPLQGLLSCAYCGGPMSPHYVFHKAGKQRRRDSYIHHYVCTMYRKYGRECGHSNRILAKTAEAWILERIQHLKDTPGLIEQALESARLNCEGDLQPAKDALALAHAGLTENQREIDELVKTMSSGGATGALLDFLNERANQLKLQREELRAEQRRLTGLLTPLANQFDAPRFRQVLNDFWALAAAATPTEMRRILQTVVTRLDWGEDGTHRLVLHDLPTAPTTVEAPTALPPMAATAGDAAGAAPGPNPLTEAQAKQSQPLGGQDWFDIYMGNGCPSHRSIKPVVLRLPHRVNGVVNRALARFAYILPTHPVTLQGAL